jgi:hypothetical protein
VTADKRSRLWQAQVVAGVGGADGIEPVTS